MAIDNCSEEVVLPFANKSPNLSSYITILSNIVSALLLLLGMIGNSFVAYIIRGLNSKTMHDFYLRYMLTFTALACFFDLLNSLERFRNIFKHKFCLSRNWVIYISRYNRALFWTFTQTSGLTLCMLLLDRYVSILFPLKYKSYQNKKRLLKILPYIFLISVSIFCFGGDFWYSVIECHEQSLNRTVYYRGVPPTFSRYKTRIVIDILNEILLSIVPALIMLYLASRITLSLRRFLKRKRLVLGNLAAIPVTEQKRIKRLYRLFPLALRSKIKFNSIGPNIDEPGISKINLDKRPSSNKLTSFTHSNYGRIPNINISSLIFFALFFICYMPSSITVFLRHYLIFRDKIIAQRHKNACTGSRLFLNSTKYTTEVNVECNNPYATFITLNGMDSNLSIVNSTSSLNDKYNCESKYLNTGKAALESLYRFEVHLENLDSLYISLVFCVALITDKRILKKFKRDLRALLRAMKNIF
ncbi:unnamed protein product [Gordionus sp. m RMFG-2023]